MEQYKLQHFKSVVWSISLGRSGDVAYACTNIQQVAKEEEEEEDTPHVDTWHNVRVWVDFFGGLH